MSSLSLLLFALFKFLQWNSCFNCFFFLRKKKTKVIISFCSKLWLPSTFRGYFNFFCVLHFTFSLYSIIIVDCLKWVKPLLGLKISSRSKGQAFETENHWYWLMIEIRSNIPIYVHENWSPVMSNNTYCAFVCRHKNLWWSIEKTSLRIPIVLLPSCLLLI